MVRYVPRLANGQLVKLSWPLKLCRLNHMFWPLDSSTTTFWRRLHYTLAILGTLIYLLHNDFELRYLRYQYNNLDALLTGVPTYMILVESQFRTFHALIHGSVFQTLLEKFFANIYVDRRQELKVFKDIEFKLIPNRIVSASYLAAVSGYILAPVAMLISQRRQYLFSMIPAIDTESLYIFIPLTLSSVWVALTIVALVFGETALLCELISHLKGRYVLLKRDMDASIDNILAVPNPPEVAKELRGVLIRTLRKNVALNRFGQELEEHFTVRIFIMFSFSAALLCALGFKTYASPTGDYIYPIWFIAKTVELLTLGQMGSDLAYLTNDLNTMYYESKWEQVIYYSTNSRENLILLKVIALAIELNYKPLYLTGLKYFSVSLQTVLKILQGAFSYFTFLTSMR